MFAHSITTKLTATKVLPELATLVREVDGRTSFDDLARKARAAHDAIERAMTFSVNRDTTQAAAMARQAARILREFAAAAPNKKLVTAANGAATQVYAAVDGMLKNQFASNTDYV